uniref:glutamine synthetase n=1 Tax=viral metagenome TaxID=1070528 RepID=A0A6C0IYJ8_9ZZZZ
MLINSEYIWLDSKNNLRSKNKILNIDIELKNNDKKPSDMEIVRSLMNVRLYPNWNCNAKQIGDNVSEIILHPVFVCLDPFKKAPNVFVLCDTYNSDGNPTEYNTRYTASKMFEKNENLKTIFGFEQEFYVMKLGDNFTMLPDTTICKGLPEKGNQYYCSNGSMNAFGRNLVNKAIGLALEAGLSCSGFNSSSGPAQWEIQIGPVQYGISAADHLIILRFILARLSENLDIHFSLLPNPLGDEHSLSYCHTNFSTESMRGSNGYKHIESSVEKLRNTHNKDVQVYGKNNIEIHNNFTSDVTNRNVSVRIPTESKKNNKGYLEDRRPLANCDPYLVCETLLKSVL